MSQGILKKAALAKPTRAAALIALGVTTLEHFQ